LLTALLVVVAQPLAASAMTVTSARLPDGVAGVGYATRLAVIGGTAPDHWSLTSGAMPAGLKLSPAGLISGKPSRAGSYAFKVKVSDSATPKHTATRALSLSVYRVLAITTGSLATGLTGHAYSARLAAAGGLAPVAWKLASGALPAGLRLSAAGTISGTPAAVGHARFTVQVTDAARPAVSARKTFTLFVTGTALPSGGTLRAGDYLVSPSGQYNLVMQTDGNLVEYFDGDALWASGTGGTGNYLAMQSDGNLVVYTSTGHALWSSKTGGHSPASYSLAMQSDANVVVYGPSGPVWASSTTQPSVVPVNGVLDSGWSLRSPSGQYTLVMQTDGNLVEYFEGDALWASNTSGDAGDHAVMQSDGNLVLYTSTGHALWSSKTGGHSPASYILALQSDANLVIYGPSGAVWATSTPPPGALTPGQGLNSGWTLRSPNSQFTLVMQGDGNLVIYGPSGPIWASNTAGTGGANYLVMQTDGNLVVYQAGGHPVWASNTGGTGNYLAMQSDGNLVVYQPGGHPVWASNSSGSGSGGLTMGQWAGTAGPKAANQYYGYPYPNAPQCTNGGACVLDAWKFYQGQCTSWVAYRLNQLNGIGFNDYYGGRQWGDASNWASAAQNLHISVNTTPAVGAVAWYSADHVAYVEKVNSPTSIVISEMNYDYGNGFRVRTVTAGHSGWPTDFIHIADR
jgi:surface antigen